MANVKTGPKTKKWQTSKPVRTERLNMGSMGATRRCLELPEGGSMWQQAASLQQAAWAPQGGSWHFRREALWGPMEGGRCLGWRLLGKQKSPMLFVGKWNLRQASFGPIEVFMIGAGIMPQGLPLLDSRRS